MKEVTMEELAENVDNVQFGDDRLGVMFYMRSVEDKERSATEGRRCFKDREFIRIMIPGDRNPAADRPVQRTGTLPTDDVLRFPKQYARFKQQIEQQAHDGTPLALWPQMPASLADELRFINIFTVEQLADLADTYVSKVPMGYKWKQKAQEFVQAMSDGAVVNQLNAALEERDNRIATLEAAIAEQSEQIKELMSRKK